MNTSPADARRPDRPAPCRSDAGGAARTHQHRAPSTDRPADPATRLSAAVTSTGSPPCPTAANRAPAPPGQGQPDWHQCSLQAGAAARMPLGQPRYLLDERARGAARRGRRRTGAPSTTPRPAARRRADPPGAADSGYAPASRPARTGGSATPAPEGAHRSPPRRRLDRRDRSPPVTDAGAEPGNSIHQPQTQRTSPVSRHHGMCDRTSDPQQRQPGGAVVGYNTSSALIARRWSIAE